MMGIFNGNFYGICDGKFLGNFYENLYGNFDGKRSRARVTIEGQRVLLETTLQIKMFEKS